MEGRYVSTSCKNDNLTFYDGLTTKARRLKNSYITCGSTWYGNLPKLYSSGNEMLVVFRTNERIAAKGFRLTYTRSKKFVDSMAL